MSLKGYIKRKKYFWSNPEIYRQYQEVKTVNNFSGGGVKIWQAERLEAIKRYAIKYTDFYKDYSMEASFPIMTKSDFLNNYEKIRSREKFNLPNHSSSTSGSTGIPFTVIQNFEKRQRTIADLKVFGEYANYFSHEKMLQLRAYNGKTLDYRIDRKENIFRYDISNLKEENINKLLIYINQIHPRILFGYTSTLETLSNYILSRKINMSKFHIKTVLVGAETLTDEIAEKIKQAFQCPLFDRYSNMEMGIYAQREYGKTNFKVNNGSYYFEIIRLEEDIPAKEGEVGRIVVTDLFNHAFPMIRYDTGDLGKYCIKDDKMELYEIYGRKIDCIYDIKGNILDPHSISRCMCKVKNVRQWQFIQKNEKEYLLKVNISSEIEEQDIKNRLCHELGDAAKINIQYVDEIPVLNSSKRKYIMNEYKRQKNE